MIEDFPPNNNFEWPRRFKPQWPYDGSDTVSKEELKLIEEEEARYKQEYDPFQDPDWLARKHGMVCHLPKEDELFIDIDTEEQYEEFCRRYDYYCSVVNEFREATTKISVSSSGLPHRHIIVKVPGMSFDYYKRLAFQAALGDDPLRIYLNCVRVACNFEPPITFFEQKIKVNVHVEPEQDIAF